MKPDIYKISLTNNIITKTGQGWKLIAMTVVGILAGISIAYGNIKIDSLTSEEFFYFVAGGAVVGLIPFVFACVSIKCPSCGSRWFWSAVRGKGHEEWLIWLFSIKTC